MGLEEHLLTMFREDFEFSDENGPSHHAAHAPRRANQPGMAAEAAAPEPILADALQPNTAEAADEDGFVWDAEASAELKKIPFFVRGKARRNTERYAAEQGVSVIDLSTLYNAKSHYAR
jgi:light-independent protochlorophyllide reductase subunit B